MVKKRGKHTANKPSRTSKRVKTLKKDKHKAGKPSYKHRLQKHKIQKPNTGIRLIYGYTSFLAVLYLIYFILGLIKPSLFLLKSSGSIIIDIFLLSILFSVVYGFHNKKKWVWKLSLGWYFIMIVYSIILIQSLRKGTYNISTELFAVAILSIILINCFIIWYIHKKKNFFMHKDRAVLYSKEDKIFVYVLITFWVMLIAISGTVGVNFYGDTKDMTNVLVPELNQIVALGGHESGFHMCNAKLQPEKDLCFVILTTMTDGKKSYCDHIESQIYKVTCLQALES